MAKKNRKYWEDRAIRMEGEKEALAEELAKRTRKSYIRSFHRLTDEINALYAEIMSRPEPELTRTELYNLRHYSALRELIAKEIEGLAIKDSAGVTALLESVASTAYKENYKEFGLEFNMFAEHQAKAIAAQNWSGVTYSDRIWGNANDLNSRIMNDIESMIIGGKNPDQLKKQLMKDYNVGFNEADRLIRTEASYAYNEAAINSYKDAGCMEVDFLAEADCCDVCHEYRGKRFKIAGAPVIPVHPNCRCTYLPVIE